MYGRLHVNIYDSEKAQFTIPPDVIFLSSGEDDATLTTRSDLTFHYTSRPFEFWIMRRSDPHGTPLFDTRAQSLPPTPIPPVIPTDNGTALDGFPLVFEDQYLQLTSALPLGANVYGLGEVLASSGFRRDVGTNGGVGTVQTMWARDSPDPIDENMYVPSFTPQKLVLTCAASLSYGSHPIYLEHRYDERTKRSKSHGVFHFGYGHFLAVCRTFE